MNESIGELRIGIEGMEFKIPDLELYNVVLEDEAK